MNCQFAQCEAGLIVPERFCKLGYGNGTALPTPISTICQFATGTKIRRDHMGKTMAAWTLRAVASSQF